MVVRRVVSRCPEPGVIENIHGENRRLAEDRWKLRMLIGFLHSECGVDMTSLGVWV